MVSQRYFVTILFAVMVTAFIACEKDDKDDAENNANPSEEVSPIDDVVTGEAVNLSYTSATLYGYINNSLQNITSMGIVYGTEGKVRNWLQREQKQQLHPLTRAQTIAVSPCS